MGPRKGSEENATGVGADLLCARVTAARRELVWRSGYSVCLAAASRLRVFASGLSNYRRVR